MTYIDGFVAAVPTANKEAYLKHAKDSVPVFKKYGALRCMENWGVDVPDGELTSFPLAVKAKPDETIVLAWIVWPSKQVRDAGMEKAVQDPFFTEETEMPFDGSRMLMGGFETILDE
ncbi:MAG: DUF1428 domain-containing protein [Henriciella sp.]